MSCVICYYFDFGISDGLLLGLGDGGKGLGSDCLADAVNMFEQWILCNLPVLFNLGVYEFNVLFVDGWIEVDFACFGGLRILLADDMVVGFVLLLLV